MLVTKLKRSKPLRSKSARTYLTPKLKTSYNDLTGTSTRQLKVTSSSRLILKRRLHGRLLRNWWLIKAWKLKSFSRSLFQIRQKHRLTKCIWTLKTSRTSSRRLRLTWKTLWPLLSLHRCTESRRRSQAQTWKSMMSQHGRSKCLTPAANTGLLSQFRSGSHVCLRYGRLSRVSLIISKTFMSSLSIVSKIKDSRT